MAEDKHSPLEQFTITPIYDIKLGGVDISITNSTVFLFAVTFVIMLFFTIGLRRSSVIPSRFQVLVESLYEFIAGMVSENIGKEGIKYVPFVFSLFVLILGCNLTGLIPYTFTVTSHIATTFSLAIFCFLLINVIAFVKHGFHYLHLFVPEGVPKLFLPIITPIELISYMIRPISLGIRLCVAMTASHIAMKIFAAFVISLGSVAYVLGLIPLSFTIILVGLEFLVSFVQAFIFSILVCIYLNDAINMH